MWRIILEPALLFGSPFVAYVIYLILRQRYPFAVDHWTRSDVATLVLAGLFTTVVGVFAFGLFSPRHQGTYVPAHIENGRLTPGQLQ
ncbi:MAG: DUF6111 family protein [Methylocella sp.]